MIWASSELVWFAFFRGSFLCLTFFTTCRTELIRRRECFWLHSSRWSINSICRLIICRLTGSSCFSWYWQIIRVSIVCINASRHKEHIKKSILESISSCLPCSLILWVYTVSVSCKYDWLSRRMKKKVFGIDLCKDRLLGLITILCFFLPSVYLNLWIHFDWKYWETVLEHWGSHKKLHVFVSYSLVWGCSRSDSHSFLYSVYFCHYSLYCFCDFLHISLYG